ncbi:MAG: LIC_10091 family protein [Gemmatimonadaceae bacterium]
MPLPHARSRVALLAALIAAAAVGCGAPKPAERASPRATAGRDSAPISDSAFAAAVAAMSEAGGYFDTDNLVSNEASYLYAVDAIRGHGTRGGAYIGVGPDQNFSYIAATGPAIAYLIDIRRDNLLQHLLYRALFTIARNRAEYLLILTGRAVGDDVESWTGRPLDGILAHVASAPADPDSARTRGRLLRTVADFDVPLTDEDVAVMGRILDAFARDGLDLRFSSFGRSPNADYPSFGGLLAGRDRAGNQASYLATEEDFATVQRLQRAGRVIPVVGDLAGPHALARIGRDIARRGLVVSVLYVSNVEYYLMGDGTFGRFAATAAALPRDERSLLVRSCFRRACGPAGPDSGSASAQIVQPLDSLAALHERGAYRSYADVVRLGVLPPSD